MSKFSSLSGMMVDIATMATTPTARILSIAAVRFDIDTAVIDKEFKVNLKIGSRAKQLVLSTNPKTMSYWLSKPELLKKQLSNSVDYCDGIEMFADYCARIKPAKYWAQSVNQYDLPILAHSLSLVMGEDYILPWQFGNACDIKTLENCFSDTVYRGGASGDPQVDVVEQAQYVIDFFKGLEE